jgi:hypothetical protein
MLKVNAVFGLNTVRLAVAAYGHMYKLSMFLVIYIIHEFCKTIVSPSQKEITRLP